MPQPVEIKINQSGNALSGIKSIESGLLSLGKTAAIVGAAAATAIAAIGVVATKAAIDFGKESISMAGDALEMQNKFNVVFGELAKSTEDFLDKLAVQTGRNKFELREFASTLQDTFVPLGFARDQSAELSKSLVQLAIDVASFDNVASADVIEDFQSAIVGNHETVKKYGIIINQTTIEQELFNMGIAGGIKNATELEKTQARVNIIFKGTQDAMGDAVETADSWNNTIVRMKSQSDELKVAIGMGLIPVFQPLLKAMADLGGAIGSSVIKFLESPIWKQFTDKIGPILVDIFHGLVFNGILPFLDALGLLPKKFFEDGSFLVGDEEANKIFDKIIKAAQDLSNYLNSSEFKENVEWFAGKLKDLWDFAVKLAGAVGLVIDEMGRISKLSPSEAGHEVVDSIKASIDSGEIYDSSYNAGLEIGRGIRAALKSIQDFLKPMIEEADGSIFLAGLLVGKRFLDGLIFGVSAGEVKDSKELAKMWFNIGEMGAIIVADALTNKLPEFLKRKWSEIKWPEITMPDLKIKPESIQGWSDKLVMALVGVFSLPFVGISLIGAILDSMFFGINKPESEEKMKVNAQQFNEAHGKSFAKVMVDLGTNLVIELFQAISVALFNPSIAEPLHVHFVRAIRIAVFGSQADPTNPEPYTGMGKFVGLSWTKGIHAALLSMESGTLLKDGVNAVVNILFSQFKTKLGITGNTSSTTENFGKNIIQGLMNGLRSKWGELIALAQAIANSIVNTIQGALQIQSPSKVMEHLGRMTSKGFYEGMEKENNQQSNNFAPVININNPSVRSDADIKSIAQQVMFEMKKMNNTYRGGFSTGTV